MANQASGRLLLAVIEHNTFGEDLVGKALGYLPPLLEGLGWANDNIRGFGVFLEGYHDRNPGSTGALGCQVNPFPFSSPTPGKMQP